MTRPAHRQRGVTLLELLIVLALSALMLTVTFALSLPIIAQEKARGAIRDVQALLQLARSEAVTRNHSCRFVVDPSQGELRVYDTVGTAGSTADDVLLHQRRLSRTVGFARPDGGSPVTLAAGDGSTFQTVFESSGAVFVGTGEIYVYGGDRYLRLTLYGAGGTEIAQWKDGSWQVGS